VHASDPQLQRAFGAALRELRLKRRLTQEQVAHEAGLGLNYVSDLERGRRNPSLLTIVHLSRSLGVSAADLIRRTEKARLAR
jgi:transcriptional regulator with XRE-family HTH domain